MWCRKLLCQLVMDTIPKWKSIDTVPFFAQVSHDRRTWRHKGSLVILTFLALLLTTVSLVSLARSAFFNRRFPFPSGFACLFHSINYLSPSTILNPTLCSFRVSLNLFFWIIIFFFFGWSFNGDIMPMVEKPKGHNKVFFSEEDAATLTQRFLFFNFFIFYFLFLIFRFMGISCCMKFL